MDIGWIIKDEQREWEWKEGHVKHYILLLLAFWASACQGPGGRLRGFSPTALDMNIPPIVHSFES
jgi:hypothetical protein